VCGILRPASRPRLAHRIMMEANGDLHVLLNLSVAGSSIFPTGGVASPTLTIVALAIRPADHLKGLSRSPGTGTEAEEEK